MPQPTEMEMQMQDHRQDEGSHRREGQGNRAAHGAGGCLREVERGLCKFLKACQHEFRMEENAQKAMLDQGGDAVKSAAEADKAQMDLEQKAVQLEAQKVKSATEIMKAMGVRRLDSTPVLLLSEGAPCKGAVYHSLEKKSSGFGYARTPC